MMMIQLEEEENDGGDEDNVDEIDDYGWKDHDNEDADNDDDDEADGIWRRVSR